MVATEIIVAAVALSLAMTGAWAVRLRTGQSGWIDAIWSFATGLGGASLAVWTASFDDRFFGRALLVAAMAALWGLRLGAHIAARASRGGDDPRYADLARQWGDHFAFRLFWFLQIQAAVAFLLAMSVFAAARNPAPFPGVLDVIGLLVFGLSLAGETLADRQLARFAADRANKGRVCDVGLWAWSRHPNYFFEWLTWVSYALVAMNLSGGYPWGFAAFAGPVCMYGLLAHVSGVPPLEAHMLRTRGDAFRAYAARVNAFFPWPPRPDVARSKTR